MKKRRKKHRQTFGQNFGIRRLQKTFFMGWRAAVSKQTKTALAARFEVQYSKMRENKAVCESNPNRRIRAARGLAQSIF